jgi:large repetitive protein
MRGCLRPSEERVGRAAIAAAAWMALAGCGPRVLQVVDPDPCRDAEPSPRCVPPGLLDDLIGYWRLDDGAGNASVRDGSVWGNDGVLRGLDATASWLPGRAGTSLEIAAERWAVVAPSTSLDAIVDRLTIAAWVYLDGTIIEWATAASRQLGATVEQHYHLSLDPGARPHLFTTTGNGRLGSIVAPAPIPSRTWTHLAGTYDGERIVLYVDAVEAASFPIGGTFTPDETPLILGGNGNDAGNVPTELFPGRIDEIMLYRRALSAAEIAQLHAGVLFTAPDPPDAATD